MDNQLSMADQEQQYLNNIVTYKGDVVFVKSVLLDNRIKIIDMETQKTATVAFDRKQFGPVLNRLGMVNIDNHAVYIARKPMRKMTIGITKVNISIAFPNIEYSVDKSVLLSNIRVLSIKEIYKTIMNIYPSFKEALSSLKANGEGCIAFDKQFAIDFKGRVVYKMKTVGTVSLSAKSVNDIVFEEQYQYLSLLLDGNHEKTIGITCN